MLLFRRHSDILVKKEVVVRRQRHSAANLGYGHVVRDIPIVVQIPCCHIVMATGGIDDAMLISNHCTSSGVKVSDNCDESILPGPVPNPAAKVGGVQDLRGVDHYPLARPSLRLHHHDPRELHNIRVFA